jgi:MFS family permease
MGPAPGRQASPGAFAALRHRNYRLWFRGQMVSLFGTWMQTTAQGFLVYQLTRSPAYLGYVGFAAGIPSWLLTLYGGVVADRVSRRSLLLVTQASMMVLAFILAVLTFAGLTRPWHVVALAFALGVANAFDAPARQAFVSELVTREDLTNAIALNAVMFNAAVAVGPAVAGATYAAFGPAWCFAINGISFVAVIAALARMRLERTPSRSRPTSTLDELKEGIRYVVSEPLIRTLMGLAGAVSLFGISVNTLMPAWAVKILHGDATTNGLLLSLRGGGALVGAFLIAVLSRLEMRGRILTIGTFAFPLLILAFAAERHLPLALVTMFLTGWAWVLVQNLTNALMQSMVPDHLRGRLMSVFSLVLFGLMPIGSLGIGITAHQVGEPAAVAISGAMLLGVAGLVWIAVPSLRNVP